MLPSRPPVHAGWYLYNAKMPKYYIGKMSFYSDIIKDRLPSVVLTNYRWQWLREHDLQTLKRFYLPVDNQFWVLGVKLSGSEGYFTIAKKGTYSIVSKNSGQLEVNGSVVVHSQLYLERGRYPFKQEGAALERYLVWQGDNQGPIKLQFKNHKNALFQNSFRL
jgi:hypothetical protein